jgi:16S rRNA U516 pseudouridylate synthase RsuA-like enzyme
MGIFYVSILEHLGYRTIHFFFKHVGYRTCQLDRHDYMSIKLHDQLTRRII